MTKLSIASSAFTKVQICSEQSEADVCLSGLVRPQHSKAISFIIFGKYVLPMSLPCGNPAVKAIPLAILSSNTLFFGP